MPDEMQTTSSLAALAKSRCVMLAERDLSAP